MQKTAANVIPSWYMYLAASNVIIAVLSAVASFQSGTYNSLILVEKNNDGNGLQRWWFLFLFTYAGFPRVS